MTRNKSRLRSEDPVTIGVLADESDNGWLVEVSERPAVVTVAPRDEVADRGDVRLEGPAVAVYLTLWNRSDELAGSGRACWTRGGALPSPGAEPAGSRAGHDPVAIATSRNGASSSPVAPP